MTEHQDNKRKRSQRMILAREKGIHTKAEWLEMKEFFHHTCVKCNGESGLLNVDKDHIIPVYQGGSDSIKNIQPLCAKCNASKGPENKDYRQVYCSKNRILMPVKWKNND